MDENQTSETETYPKAAAYIQLFSTVAAAGMLFGAGVVVGHDLTRIAKGKIQKFKKTRSTKKKLTVVK